MKLKEVNSSGIPRAIRLGSQTMSNAFDADDNDVPFFDVVVSPGRETGIQCHLLGAHVPGRHLNALLNAQEASGINLDEEAIEKHSRATFLSYNGPVARLPPRCRQSGSRVDRQTPGHV